MSDKLLQSIKRLEQLLIHLLEIFKCFLYMSDKLLQSIKGLEQLIIYLQEMLKRFL